MHIFLTGATGFIGRALCRHLENTGVSITCTMRKPAAGMPDNHFFGTRRCFVGSLGAHTDFGGYLEQTDVVIHAAGFAHMPTRSDYDLLGMFFEVNLHATKNLALQAAQKGVPRFVYISSAAVMGRSSSGRAPFS
jgi:nucleoside-diphosphate-sugar epimerase